MFTELLAQIKKWYPDILFNGPAHLHSSELWPESVNLFCSVISLDDDIWNCQDTLLFPDRVVEVDGLYKFMVENQGVVTWYFENKDSDPMTYVDSVDKPNAKIPQGKFSHFIKMIFYQNLKFRVSDFMLWGHLDGKERRKINDTYSDNLQGQVYWPGQDTGLYDCGDFVIEFESMNKKDGPVYISCINETTLKAVINSHPEAAWELRGTKRRSEKRSRNRTRR